MAKIHSAHPGLDEAGLGLYAQQADLVNGLHVLDGVPGAHDRVAVAAPGKYLHFDRLLKGLHGGLFAEARIQQVLPAPRLLHRLGNDLVGPGHRIPVVKIKRTRGAAFDLPEKRLLELGHVLFHGLFGGALHAAVDRGVNFQAVGVEVVLASVGLAVGFDPFLHKLADVLAQVGRQALVVPARGEVDLHRNRLQGVRLFFGQVVAPLHLVNHRVAAVERGLLAAFAGRIIKPGVFAHAHQRGGLFDGQFVGLLAEVHVGRIVHAHTLIQKVELVEVHRNQLLFGVARLELHGNDPFLGLLEQALKSARRLVEHLLGKLLRDRGTPAVAAELHHGTG